LPEFKADAFSQRFAGNGVKASSRSEIAGTLMIEHFEDVSKKAQRENQKPDQMP
jgi:hypothetical protein